MEVQDGEENMQSFRWYIRAKKDALAADELISQYMNFIRSETARHTHALSSEGQGMMSLALPCLHFMRLFRDINGERQVFFPMLLLPSATVWLIIIEKRNATRDGFLERAIRDGEQPLSDRIPSGEDGMKQWTVREATKRKLEEFASNLMEYGLSLSEVADNCPKQERTLAACHRALQATRSIGILERFVKTGGPWRN